MNYEEYLERMGTDTTGRYDVTPLFADPETFEALRADLLAGVTGKPTAVVGIDALGFVLGGALATDIGVGFAPVRKGGKLPYSEEELHSREVIDYTDTSKVLELHPDVLGASDRALVVDDWVETGAQMRAAAELVEAAGASVEAIAAVKIHRNEGTEPLFEQYEVHGIG